MDRTRAQHAGLEHDRRYGAAVQLVAYHDVPGHLLRRVHVKLYMHPACHRKSPEYKPQSDTLRHHGVWNNRRLDTQLSGTTHLSIGDNLRHASDTFCQAL